MLGHYPEPVAHPAVTDWGTPWLATLPANSFEERIPRERKSDGKQELAGQIKEVFLQQVNGPMFEALRQAVSYANPVDARLLHMRTSCQLRKRAIAGDACTGYKAILWFNFYDSTLSPGHLCATEAHLRTASTSGKGQRR